MSEPTTTPPKRRDSGTYLLVRQGSPTPRRFVPPPSTDPLQIPPLATGVFAAELGEPTGERVRYRPLNVAPRHFDRRLVALFAPDGGPAQALAGIAATLAAEARDRPLTITAAEAGAGRTTVALNLALALAGARRVTVIELDLCSPGVGQAFAVPPNGGLGGLLRERRRDPRAPIDLTRIYPGLCVLPSGPELGPRVAARMLSMPELERVVAEVACVSDLVILDAPVARGAAAAALARLDTAVVLVARPETDLQPSQRALHGAAIVGVVLNETPAS